MGKCRGESGECRWTSGNNSVVFVSFAGRAGSSSFGHVCESVVNVALNSFGVRVTDGGLEWWWEWWWSGARDKEVWELLCDLVWWR